MSKEVLVKKRKGIFPGWLLLITTGVMTMCGSGITTYSPGAYVKPLIETFGWTRAQLSLAFSLGRLEGGLEGPFGGIATDKWGPRVVNLAGFLLFGVGLCLIYYINSLWMFYVVWLMVATGHNLGFGGPLDAALANWWVKRRGFMIGLKWAITALGGITVLPAVTWLLLTFGWRTAFPILGIGSLLIGIPLTWFFIKPRRPEYYGWLPDGRRVGEETAADTEATIQKGVEYAAGMEEVEFTVRQALKDRIWWICVIGMSLAGMISPVITVHTIPMLTDMGMDPMMAAAAMGTLVVVGIPGRLIFGWLGDIVPKRRLKWLVILAYLLQAIGLFILIRATSMTWVWAFLVVYGLGFGATTTAWPPLRGRYWGRKAYATIQGTMAPITMVPGIIAPVWAGWAYDTTGSYMSVFSMLFIFILLSVVVMFFANPPKPPEKVGKITEFV